jgi:hypothetical protein
MHGGRHRPLAALCQIQVAGDQVDQQKQAKVPSHKTRFSMEVKFAVLQKQNGPLRLSFPLTSTHVKASCTDHHPPRVVGCGSREYFALPLAVTRYSNLVSVISSILSQPRLTRQAKVVVTRLRITAEFSCMISLCKLLFRVTIDKNTV